MVAQGGALTLPATGRGEHCEHCGKVWGNVQDHAARSGCPRGDRSANLRG